jgi:phosphohistidine phosphatase
MAQYKTLYIGRHAKSSWDHQGRSDIDRPLAERGLDDAYTMAGRMKKLTERPQMIISSPANRALHTAVIYATGLGFPFSGFHIDPNLYMAGEDTILDIIYGIDNSIGSLMLFGHNPDFTYLANYFLPRPIDNIPTCGMVKLVFETDKWEDISKNNLSDNSFDFPKKKQAGGE